MIETARILCLGLASRRQPLLLCTIRRRSECWQIGYLTPCLSSCCRHYRRCSVGVTTQPAHGLLDVDGSERRRGYAGHHPQILCQATRRIPGSRRCLALGQMPRCMHRYCPSSARACREAKPKPDLPRQAPDSSREGLSLSQHCTRLNGSEQQGCCVRRSMRRHSLPGARRITFVWCDMTTRSARCGSDGWEAEAGACVRSIACTQPSQCFSALLCLSLSLGAPPACHLTLVGLALAWGGSGCGSDLGLASALQSERLSAGATSMH